MSPQTDSTFSIIIPFQKVTDYVVECVRECLRLNYEPYKYEIVLLPDEDLNPYQIENCLRDDMERKAFNTLVKIIPTGKVTPGKKRNIGMQQSKASYLACIDSDAYPDKNWLRNSLPHLQRADVGVVGGANKEPQNVTYMEKLAIKLVYLRTMAGNLYDLNSSKTVAREQSEMPSSNFIIKNGVARECGYFDENLPIFEDVILSFSVINKGYKILFSSEVTVYHHRRPLFIKHLVRFAQFGKMRAAILKCYAKTIDIRFFVPTGFMIFFCLGLSLSFFHAVFIFIFAVGLIAYFLIILADCISKRIVQPLDLIIIAIAAFLTHLLYGYGFLQGWIRGKKIISSYRSL